MPKYKPSICFSHKYAKLIKSEFATVRWLDSVYVLGKVYPCYFVAQNSWHPHYALGNFRVMSLRIVKLRDLLDDEFCRGDADCDADTYYKMMVKWYGLKPDWRGGESEVQIISLSKALEAA